MLVTDGMMMNILIFKDSLKYFISNFCHMGIIIELIKAESYD